MCFLSVVRKADGVSYTHIVYMTPHVEQDRLRQFAAVHPIIFPKLLRRHAGEVDVEYFLPVVRATLEHISAVGHKVVERRKHL